MAELKRTKDYKQAWLSLAALVAVTAMFVFVIMPLTGRDRKNSRISEMAPDFSLEVIHGGDPGNRIRLSTLQGKAVVLDFWASWCGPCREQMPIMERVARRFEQRDVVVVGVNTSDSRADALTFLRGGGTSYASLFDQDGRVGSAFGVTTLPVAVVIGRSGRIVDIRTRVLTERELEALIERALAG